jgi:heat shock protein HslJ
MRKNMKYSLILTSLLAIAPIANSIINLVKPEIAQAQITCGKNPAQSNYETNRYWVAICEEEDKLYLNLQNKSRPAEFIRTATTYDADRDLYIAQNGDFNYYINSERLQIWQNNRLIISDNALEARVGGKTVDLENTQWQLVIWEKVGEQNMTPLPNSNITLNFDPENKVNGFAGCNNFMSGYSIEGEMIKIELVASTMKACEEDLMSQEMKFTTALTKITRYKINAQNQLEIYYTTDEGAGLLVFDRVSQ